jgi:hypothetical protein
VPLLVPDGILIGLGSGLGRSDLPVAKTCPRLGNPVGRQLREGCVMSQVRFQKSVAAWVRVGTLAAALALVAGTAYGQQSPKPPANPPKAPAPEGKRAAVEPARPAQPQSPPEIAKAPDVTVAPPTPVGTLMLGETLSAFMIFIFAAGGVTLLAIGARFYFHMTRPADPVRLALTDPWIRANLERFEAGGPLDQPADAETPLPERPSEEPRCE